MSICEETHFEMKTTSQKRLVSSASQSAPPFEQVWVQDNYTLCLGWQRRWVKTLHCLVSLGHTTYRGQKILLKEKTLHVHTGHNVLSLTLQDPSSLSEEEKQHLFVLCHQDIASLVKNLSSPSLKDEKTISHLSNILLTQWPTDKAWKDAVLDLSRHIKQAEKSPASQLHQGRYLPRLLSERKEALVLLKKGNTWETRKGAKLAEVLAKSNPKRRELLEALTDLPMLDRIELPFNMDFEELLTIVQQINEALSGRHSLVKKSIREKRTWKIALRRIQGMGLNGCFDVATQTIIADPRHMESLKHELCHWLLGHDVNTNIKGHKLKNAEKDVHLLENVLFDLIIDENKTTRKQKNDLA